MEFFYNLRYPDNIGDKVSNPVALLRGIRLVFYRNKGTDIVDFLPHMSVPFVTSNDLTQLVCSIMLLR